MAWRRHMPAVPLKLKNTSARERAAVLEHKVPVEQDGFDLRQEAVVAVQVRPARLHHADLRLGEVMDHLHQPVCAAERSRRRRWR